MAEMTLLNLPPAGQAPAAAPVDSRLAAAGPPQALAGPDPQELARRVYELWRRDMLQESARRAGG